ncbi:MAG TPA: hypothetical protein PLD62_09030, partial [Candidatus Cloacimonadota bacterium]|nr:hypothetical protein [Candidatus Cloacimonadota bacterium]
MRKLVVLLAILSLAVLLYGISKTAVINKTFNVSDTSKLILDNVNGTIRITGWDKDYADVTITKKT